MLKDVVGNRVLNFVVARHWLLSPVRRVQVNVVAAAVSKQDASCLFELANEIDALQTAISRSS